MSEDKLKVLQEALDNRPQMEKRIPTLTDFIKYDEKLDEWFEDFTKKFAAYRAELEKKDKQLSDHLKKFPSDTSFLCPDCGKFIETTPSFKQQVWFKGLKELLMETPKKSKVVEKKLA